MPRVSVIDILALNESIDWAEVHARYLAGALQASLVKELGIHNKHLIPVFKKLGLRIRSRSENARIAFNAMSKGLQEEHGVQNCSQLQSVKEKKAPRLPENYKKMQGTLKREFGVENCSQLQAVKDKKVESTMRGFGVSNPLQIPEVVESVRVAKLQRSEDRIVPLMERKGYQLMEPYRGPSHVHAQRSVLGSHIKYRIKHAQCKKEFLDDIIMVPVCPHCYPQTEYRSVLERGVQDFIRGLGFDSVHLERGTLKKGYPRFNFELDIYIPELKVAFEINGLFYHSVHDKWHRKKYGQYHAMKTNEAWKQGVRLYHIWENLSVDLIESRVANVLGRSKERLFARDLDVVENLTDISEFLRGNHTHGSCGCVYSVALVWNGEIVSAIAMRKRGADLEIGRYAVRQGLQIVGGFSRLMKRVEQYARANGHTQILTYADRDWSPVAEDTVYAKTGFELVGDTGPSMYYTDFKRVWSRQKFQKHKLAQLFPTVYDDALSEQQILSAVGVYPLYTSGNWKFVRSV